MKKEQTMLQPSARK